MKVKIIAIEGIVECEHNFYLRTDKSPYEVIQFIKKELGV
jgi:hypothetical protein